MRVFVLGGGVAGMGAALLLAREGHDVTLVDRDPPSSDVTADGTFAAAERPTVPQFRQPHNFLGLGRQLLHDRLPDVYQRLLEVGAGEIDQSAFLPPGTESEPGDEDLVVVLCRRPVFDAVLRNAVDAEPDLDVRRAKVTGLTADGGRITGVVLDEDEEVACDLLVDSMGRSSHLPRWLAEGGFRTPSEVVADCGLLYFSRHFRVHVGAQMPRFTTLLAGPRGDIGFLSHSVFVGDNRTFCICIMPAATDRDLRALRDEQAFMRVARLLPGYLDWIAPDIAEPITPVLAMGAIRNLMRSYVTEREPVAPGVVAIGDALLHTNPTSAFGASQSLEHAVVLSAVLSEASDPTEVGLGFHERVREAAMKRFEAVAVEDRDRLSMYSGEPIDVTDPRDSVPLFLRLIMPRVAIGDAELLRAVLRRVNMIESPDVLANDTQMLDQGRRLFLGSGISEAPVAQPSRADVLEALAS